MNALLQEQPKTLCLPDLDQDIDELFQTIENVFELLKNVVFSAAL